MLDSLLDNYLDVTMKRDTLHLHLERNTIKKHRFTRAFRTRGFLIRDATTDLDELLRDAHARAHLVAVALGVGQN